MHIIHHNQNAQHVTVRLVPGDTVSRLSFVHLLEDNSIELSPWSEAPYQVEVVRVEYQINDCLVFLEY